MRAVAITLDDAMIDLKQRAAVIVIETRLPGGTPIQWRLYEGRNGSLTISIEEPAIAVMPEQHNRVRLETML